MHLFNKWLCCLKAFYVTQINIGTANVNRDEIRRNIICKQCNKYIQFLQTEQNKVPIGKDANELANDLHTFQKWKTMSVFTLCTHSCDIAFKVLKFIKNINNADFFLPKIIK